MRIELLRPTDPATEWQVTVDGQHVVSFSGPEAEHRAEQCYVELKTQLAVPDVPGDETPAPFA